MTKKKPMQPSSTPTRHFPAATRNSRRLLIRRLREIDRLNRKELKTLLSDTEKLKRKLRGSGPSGGSSTGAKPAA